jgi:hypothetical protein
MGIYKIILFTNMPPQIVHLETFLDVLSKWGCTWMLEDIGLMGDDGWLEEAFPREGIGGGHRWVVYASIVPQYELLHVYS